MEMLGTLGVVGAVVLGASCGLRIFLAPFVLCLLTMLGENAAEMPAFMSSPWTVGVAMVFLLVEIGGDKVAGVDQALDAAGLVLRPAWAVGIVLLTVQPDVVPMAGIVAAAGALVIGLGKARLRVQTRDVFPGEGGTGAIVSPILSLVEDVVAAVTVLGAVVVAPIGAVGLAVVAVGLHVGALWVQRWRWHALVAAA